MHYASSVNVDMPKRKNITKKKKRKLTALRGVGLFLTTFLGIPGNALNGGNIIPCIFCYTLNQEMTNSTIKGEGFT